MKAYVHYDRFGAIHGLITVNAPDDRIPMLAPAPGLFVAEVEGDIPGLKLETGEPDLDAVRKIVQTLQVATPIPRCKLVSRSPRSRNVAPE
jgi:hypothetical protein